MTGQDIITQYQSLVGDSMDSVTELNLLNLAKDQIEAERNWEFLKSVDTSQSVSSADTYLTQKTLPADFGKPLDSGIFVGTDIIPYVLIPFESRIRWQSISHRYYLNLANSSYGIMGTSSTGTIQFLYQKVSPSLTLTTSPIFPSRFHPMLAYKMAQIFYAVDQGQKSISWDDRWKAYFDEVMENMVRWDSAIQTSGYQNRSSENIVDTRTYPNIVDMD